MTGRDLISASLRLIGAIAPGETIAAQEATDGLAACNRMLSSWSAESLMVFTTAREELVLTPGTAAYTVGTGGNLNTTRPQWIQSALLRIETTTPALELPLKEVSIDEWSAIGIKDLSSTIVTTYYDDGGFPLRTLTLYPKPSAAYKLVLFSAKPLSSIATLDSVISLPPGYEDAITYNLAIRLAPEYGKAVQQSVMEIANESKANIKRQNHTPRYLKADDALLSRPNAFNILRGDSVT